MLFEHVDVFILLAKFLLTDGKRYNEVEIMIKITINL